MSGVAAVLQVAQSQVGYTEKGGPDGHSGNITKYWTELDHDLQGNPWCGVFVSWVFEHAGHPLPSIDFPHGYASCADAVAYAKKHGVFHKSGTYAPGDIIFFDWDGSGRADHTGIVVHDDGKIITTIEGNTSAGNAGSQRNGGGVYKRSRNRSHVVGVWRTAGLLGGAAAPVGKPTAAPVVNRPTLREGSRGTRVREMQVLIHRHGVPVSVDGIFGPKTKDAVESFQHKHGLPADGICGPRTWAALLHR